MPPCVATLGTIVLVFSVSPPMATMSPIWLLPTSHSYWMRSFVLA